ncbi:UDP-N-acetylmuramoyl-tripeptide--D-alanyl-D-alanine ligase [Paraburkholderia caballeronis]|uniref:UDP-N-acetylmuramoyl-tripeptide--D-alanyl-D-alanine ligase n=1 Tax=Paraburkholderia caballeronis TaxID=416943 RepID=A0A1H7Q2Y9_9BURK|nr:UDP-N-acetylmuramoyl-tripeptide--D-alanyl-D-alanine ligase [Paraburkholderia caballeronis]PXW24462.1 UDP-N-acetylmuramoyl-tripeptide--D-alanyl-D-alanine ligase [Paraburkholderia caballeronis]PXX00244.1 UDP-N-acetylmuramoyl-tripeptide--D-alanyl-D-alanine ligase [Paraburkholderia caballeronis]RAJ97373.1 UDP-N-acetylmuramoyl-tripeptide--D-alanyl-D-alanine ligase [Paraburkholderia caballeronis]SEB61548.1 UDP-N-acetylmuramoyl-tripeptide--D-alanyl-D-alanine ligase [Paraburkholderia caballeronis]S
MTMFSLREAAALIPGASVLGDDAATFERVSTDSRTAGPGDLFVALKGDRFDAHDFLPEVANRHVSAVLVSRSPGDWRIPALRVDDTRGALGALARGWRRRFAAPLVAVTGSNGKTTVKEMIASIFAAAVGADARLATAGNFNNDIGLPLTLLRLSGAHRLAVVELGMNHPGETQQLAQIAEPTVAVVNNAQREHQEFMATVEAVALEHASVIHALTPEGVAVFPADDAYAGIWRVAATGSQVMDFALHTPERAVDAAVTGTFVGNRLTIDTPQGRVEAALQALGAHNAHNALAATAAALAAGVSLDAIRHGLEAFEPVKGRLQVKQAALGALAGATVIDDTYNANPDSARAAIDVLALQPSPRVLVMGDMGEVGDDGPAFHREVGAYAKERGIDALYTLGDASRDMAAAYGANAHHAADVGALVGALAAAGYGPAATILVKGSRFMQMERVVAALASPHNNPAPDAKSGAH